MDLSASPRAVEPAELRSLYFSAWTELQTKDAANRCSPVFCRTFRPSQELQASSNPSAPNTRCSMDCATLPRARALYTASFAAATLCRKLDPRAVSGAAPLRTRASASFVILESTVIRRRRLAPLCPSITGPRSGVTGRSPSRWLRLLLRSTIPSLGSWYGSGSPGPLSHGLSGSPFWPPPFPFLFFFSCLFCVQRLTANGGLGSLPARYRLYLFLLLFLCRLMRPQWLFLFLRSFARPLLFWLYPPPQLPGPFAPPGMYTTHLLRWSPLGRVVLDLVQS